MSKIIEGLFYSESHEWVKVEDDGMAVIGITDFAQKSMGNIVYVDMPDEDDEVFRNEEFGAVESVKAASDLYSPVTGVVAEHNQALEDDPGLINRDPYAGWIIRVRMNDPSETAELMDATAYAGFLSKQE